MADLRMLQEQTQQLQALMNGLGEALKAVTSRLDDQTSLERKAFADGKVQMDAMSGDIRVVREKVDETNVRLGSISQELESLRQAIPEPGACRRLREHRRPTIARAAELPPAALRRVAPQRPPDPGMSAAARCSTASYADYTSGNYSLAVQGFESFLKYFPKSAQAHEAQLLHRRVALQRQERRGSRRRLRSRDRKLSALGFRAPGYYKRGRRSSGLAKRDRRGSRIETVIKEFPEFRAGCDLANSVSID